MREVRKIGLVSAHSFLNDGGVQRHIIAVYREFKKLGLDVKIIAPGHGKPAGVPEEDVINIGRTIPVFHRFFTPNGSNGSSYICLKKRQIPQVLERENFDVVHFHNMDIGLLCGQILRACADMGIPTVLTFHGALDGSRLVQWFPFTLKLVYHLLYRRPVDGGIAVSSAAMDTLGRFSGLKTATIPNGVDFDTFGPDAAPLNRSEFRDGKKNILFIGRFEKRKGLIYLLRAFKHLRSRRGDIRLIVGGKSGWYSRTKAKFFVWRNRLSDDVWLEGRIPEHLLASYYATADVFCAPSVSGESFGMVLLEAMQCGTAVVAFDNQGYGGLLRQDAAESGPRLADFLVKPKDWRALAAATEKLLDNEGLRKEVVRRGLLFTEWFAWAPIAHADLNFYREVVAEKKKSTASRTSLAKQQGSS